MTFGQALQPRQLFHGQASLAVLVPQPNDLDGQRRIARGHLVDLIDKVEIVRGPGSVLYGDNAFFAVVTSGRSGPKTSGTLSFPASSAAMTRLEG
jgi:hypothetical protein